MLKKDKFVRFRARISRVVSELIGRRDLIAGVLNQKHIASVNGILTTARVQQLLAVQVTEQYQRAVVDNFFMRPFLMRGLFLFYKNRHRNRTLKIIVLNPLRS